MRPSVVVVVVVMVGLAAAAPPSYPILDSPETRLWKTLTPTERHTVVRMAVTGDVGAGNALISDPSPKDHTSHARMNSLEVLKLALEMRHWMRGYWQLTPDQMEEIKETGQLCNDQGECIDFGGDWGNNCCPFG